jgi:hypothetical protein
MNDTHRLYIVTVTGIFAAGLLFLASLEVNNPLSDKKSKSSMSFLHRFVALELLYFSIVILIRELLVIDIRGPLDAIDRNTLGFVSSLGPQFLYSVFNIVVGILALDFDGGALPGVILIIRGVYLLYPTIIGKDFGDMMHLDDLKKQTLEQFSGFVHGGNKDEHRGGYHNDDNIVADNGGGEAAVSDDAREDYQPRIPRPDPTPYMD